MQNYSDERIVNVGVGRDCTIKELATLIASIVGFEGELRFDSKRPDGAQQKLLDVTAISELGWAASIGLVDGISGTYEWFKENYDK